MAGGSLTGASYRLTVNRRLTRQNSSQPLPVTMRKAPETGRQIRLARGKRYTDDAESVQLVTSRIRRVLPYHRYRAGGPVQHCLARRAESDGRPARAAIS
jgi:hypothetical protein